MSTDETSTTSGSKRKATTSTTTTSTATKPPGSKGTGGYDMPWVEKYRPRTLDDVVGNDDTLVRLRAIAIDGNMPNLILCGPPGTGKVCAIIFYNRLFSCVLLHTYVTIFSLPRSTRFLCVIGCCVDTHSNSIPFNLLSTLSHDQCFYVRPRACMH